MWEIDANVFAIRMMRDTLERRSIQWTPTSRLYFCPQPFRRKDAYVEKHISNISAALEKLSGIEYELDEEEYEHLQNELRSNEDFIDFFVNCVSACYMKDYSPLNFIRYLRYIIDFSVVCFSRGFSDVFDYAVASIAQTIFRHEVVFVHFENWKRLFNETERILQDDFHYPYGYNRFIYDKNALKRGEKNKTLFLVPFITINI